MLKNNYLRNKLETGKVVLGTWSIVPSAVVADIIAGSGLDFILIDMEHGPINYETAQNMIMACESRQVSAGIRVPGVIEADILRALDIGAHCLHVPNVNNQEQVEKVISFAKYPPVGKRGFSPFTRAGNYSAKNAKELTSLANRSVLTAVHVEGVDAVKNIESILSVKDIDIIFIGLFDISKSLGIPGEVDDARVIKTLKEITTKTSRAGKYAGTIVNNPEQIMAFIDYGIRYITYSVDCDIIRKSYKEICLTLSRISK